ncbi:MAG TPA: hypothetical protein VFR81_05765 [Longimicrobium sp.]|nr:hypothetical protein [Longimicrobium sp.]
MWSPQLVHGRSGVPRRFHRVRRTKATVFGDWGAAGGVVDCGFGGVAEGA